MSYFLEREWQVLSLDVEQPKISEHKKVFVKLDVNSVTDFGKVAKEFKPTHLVHLAATTGVEDQSLENFGTNFRFIGDWISILENIEGFKKAVFTSSLLVCRNGYSPKSPLDFCPPNAYGHSKALSEIFVREHGANIAWDIVRLYISLGPMV